MAKYLQSSTVAAKVVMSLAVLSLSCGQTEEDPGNASGGSASGGESSGGSDSGGGDSGGGGAGGADSGGAGGSSGGATAGGAGGGLGGTGASSAGGAASCPVEPPTGGESCTPPWVPGGGAFPELSRVHCSWGDDPRPGCRTTALCDDGTWMVSVPDSSSCGDLLPPECGSTPPAAQSECPSSESACYFSDGTTCVCSECSGGSAYPVCQTVDPPQWACRPPAEGCPAVLPQAGAPCNDEGLNCGRSCDAPLRCQDGVWQWLSCQTCCPICAAPDTPIATPTGERPIAELKRGDLVYSLDHGAVRAVPLLRVAHTPVQNHHVVRVTLQSGRVLQISPGHPTADGRTFSELGAGMWLDESHPIKSAELVPFSFAATYDILPASNTGTYFAAGVLIGSTLFLPQ